MVKRAFHEENECSKEERENLKDKEVILKKEKRNKRKLKTINIYSKNMKEGRLF